MPSTRWRSAATATAIRRRAPSPMPGDAKVLADLVRTDRHNHRPVAGDSELAEAVKVLARAHQSLVWTRQRQVNQLRSAAARVLPGRAWPPSAATWPAATPWPCLAVAPTPTLGRRPVAGQAGRSAAPGRPATQPRASGRSRSRPPCAHRSSRPPPVVAEAYGAAVAALVGGGRGPEPPDRAGQQASSTDRFETHPDAEIVRSLPGLGLVLGARVLGEFGDDPNPLRRS